MLDEQRMLLAIGSTEPSTFSEICKALEEDCPTKGDRAAWSRFFRILTDLEAQGNVEIDRIKGNIDQAQLTPQGADRIRGELDSRRGLLGYLEERKKDIWDDD